MTSDRDKIGMLRASERRLRRAVRRVRSFPCRWLSDDEHAEWVEAREQERLACTEYNERAERYA